MEMFVFIVFLGLQVALYALLGNDVVAELDNRVEGRFHNYLHKPNILFIVADDMRPQLSCYAQDKPSKITPKMHTPNLDRLARQSFVAGRAQVQYAMCGPSRTSFLTSRRPDTTHVYDNLHYFRKVGGNFTTLPQYFKEHGYQSVGMGKIFHPGTKSSGRDDPPSWSTKYWQPSNINYWWMNRTRSWFAVPPNMRKQYPLPDEQTAKHAVKILQDLAPEAKTGKQPFFLAVGFLKPHLPFVFPQEFLQYYPKHDIHLPDNAYAPVDMPKVAWNPYYELRTYHDISALNVSGAINSTLPDSTVLDLRRAYYSALTYTDYLIGMVIQALDVLGLRNNTIISFIGDHGWQLGEHGEWCKQTNFELSTHAPLMISVPGITTRGISEHQEKGKSLSDELIEFVDIFPTISDLAGLPTLKTCPTEGSGKVQLCTEGRSFASLISHTFNHNDRSKAWPLLPKKTEAFSQFARHEDGNKVMGYTMRTNKYRYSEWVKFTGKPLYKPSWDKLYGVELYDHTNYPEENINVASELKYRGICAMLSKILHSSNTK